LWTLPQPENITPDSPRPSEGKGVGGRGGGCQVVEI